MIEHADISVARNGDILIITDSDVVQSLSRVAYSISDQRLCLYQDNRILARIPLTEEDINCFSRTKEVSFLNIKSGGEQDLFMDIPRLDPKDC